MRAFEQLPGEGAKPFRAFGVYRDLGPGRTLDRAARAYYGWHQESTKRAPGTFKRWSARFDWPARARAFDDWVEIIRRQAIEDHLRESGPELMRRQEQVQEELLTVKERLLPQLKAMASWPLERRETERVEYHPDGCEKLIVENVSPAKWDFGTLGRLVAILDETPAAVDVRHIDFDKLSDEELDRIVGGESVWSVLLDRWRNDDGPELGP